MSAISRALVTGSTSGIGRAVAIKLAADGFEVVVHGRDGDRGREVVKAIEAEHGRARARFVAADVRDLGEVKALAEAAGPIDVLVNNSGFSWFGPTADLPADKFDELFAANVRAPYYLVAALAPAMIARRSGRIINIGSMAAQVGLAGGAAYSATKGALAAMTRSWAAELAPHGILVNTVAPGPVFTGVSRERIAALGSTTLLARAAEATEIASAVAFLASPGATYITGALIPVDGGRTAV